MAVRRLADDAVVQSLLITFYSCVSSPFFFCTNKISRHLMDLLTDGLTFHRASARSLSCLFVRSQLSLAALLFSDSPLRCVLLPSEILRRYYAEKLCHRRLIRLPEPALREKKREKTPPIKVATQTQPKATTVSFRHISDMNLN